MKSNILSFVLFAMVSPLLMARTPVTMQNQLVSVAEKTFSAVVVIYSLQYQGSGYAKKNVGSGFFIHENGTLVTNYHVIENASALAIKTKDGEVYPGRIIGFNRNVDIAVLKVEGKKRFPKLSFTDTNSVKVGHIVIAIGAPFDLGYTMTTGIVSQKGRKLGLNENEDYIQTDASINPGNSGGPLLNIDGKVIGVNDCTCKSASGIGFAIDGNLASRTVFSIIHSNSAARPYAGIIMNDNASGNARPVVIEAVKGSPAEHSGFRKGDLILQIGTRKVTTVRDALTVILSCYNPGDRATFTIRRGQNVLKLKLVFTSVR